MPLKPPLAPRQVNTTTFAEAEPCTDEALIEQTAGGNTAAFELLIHRHQSPALRVAYRFVGDVQEAEDLVQEAFFKVLRNAGNYNHTARFRTWFFQILMNLCRDRLKKKKPLLFGDLPDIAQSAPDPFQALDGKRRTLSVDAAISRLPPNQRLALILCHFEELSYREAAVVLAVSEKAVESLLVRARKNLRLSLSGLRRTDVAG